MHTPIKFIKIFPDKKLQGQYCLSPFITLAIDMTGNVGLCSCDVWLPTKIGNIFESTLIEMLSSPEAVAIRQSIIDGTYQYCNEKICGILTNNMLNTTHNVPPNIKPLLENSEKFNLPYYISMSVDLTCNLSCPSCRTSITKMTEKQKTIGREMGAILMKNLFSTPTDQEITLQISTSGELFASPMLLEFVGAIRKKDFPNVKLDIQTNGLLCEQYWHRLNELQSSVFRLTITIDAARGKTYETLRRGGNWEKLIKSMEFLALKKEEIGMIFHTRMVVQKQNYQEIEEFYEFSKKYAADQIQYTRLFNWNTRSKDEHLNEDVFNPAHAEYQLACNMLARVKHLPLTITTGGLP
jgi:hypothetical protein